MKIVIDREGHFVARLHQPTAEDLLRPDVVDIEDGTDPRSLTTGHKLVNGSLVNMAVTCPLVAGPEIRTLRYSLC